METGRRKKMRAETSYCANCTVVLGVHGALLRYAILRLNSAIHKFAFHLFPSTSPSLVPSPATIPITPPVPPRLPTLAGQPGVTPSASLLMPRFRVERVNETSSMQPSKSLKVTDGEGQRSNGCDHRRPSRENFRCVECHESQYSLPYYGNEDKRTRSASFEFQNIVQLIV